ncbi:MAG: hypothetical protein AAGG07_11270 [Planctomycetota bacterium]
MAENAAPAVVWLRPEQAPLLSAALAEAGFEPIAAGCATPEQTGAAAGAMGVTPIDDLRSAMQSVECDLILLADAGPFGTDSDGTDASAVFEAHKRGVCIATLEPVPDSALGVRSGRWLEPIKGIVPLECIRIVPLPQRASAFLDAAEVLEAFGHIRSAAIELWSTPAETTLSAGLFGALDLTRWLFGEPETIDAAIVGPDHGGGVHSLPGESLRGLTGDATLTLRYADGRAAGVFVSDRAGRWNRTATLLGPAGRLRVFDDGFEWLDPEGKKVDSSRSTPTRGTPVSHSVEALSDALKRLAPGRSPTEGPVDHTAVLAIAQAALLSARTGHAESPGTIQRMLRVG